MTQSHSSSSSSTVSTTPPSAEWVAWLYALATVLCWSTVSSAFKLSLAHTSSLGLLWVAALSSALLLTLIGTTQPAWRLTTLWRTAAAPRSLMRQALILACLNPVSYYLVLFAAYARLPGQLAQPLNFTWPLVLLLLQAAMHRQWLNLRQWLALLLSFFGVVWIATGGQPLTWPDNVSGLGVILALGSTIFWAVYWLLNSHLIVTAGYHAIPLLALVSWIGAGLLTLIVMGCTFAGISTPLPPAAWLGGMYVGCFEMGLAFVCWQLALSHTNNPEMLGNIIYLTPFGSLLFLSFFVETIQPSSWLGLVFIVLGIILQSLHRSRKR